MAKASWNLEQLRARAHDSLEKHGGVDVAAFTKHSSLLRYVDGDYQDVATKASTPIYEYDKGAWGPSEVDQTVSPPGGWHNPAATDEGDFRVAAAS